MDHCAARKPYSNPFSDDRTRAHLQDDSGIVTRTGNKGIMYSVSIETTTLVSQVDSISATNAGFMNKGIPAPQRQMTHLSPLTP